MAAQAWCMILEKVGNLLPKQIWADTAEVRMIENKIFFTFYDHQRCASREKILEKKGDARKKNES